MDETEDFTLTVEVTEYVDPFPQEEAPAEEPVELAELAPVDAFDFEAWEERQAEVAASPAPEPGYYLYWYGEGDTSYWLSDQPIPDFNGVLVAGGDALYARFGQLGTYMDMDIALGYGGIRPMDHAHAALDGRIILNIDQA